ncbi:hypothetical protein, partial [Caldisericum sp.]|uniref:hypothetical protein n=1 Tax=Caldisericum sp. TaxID=2499687 RepID=UPI003D0B7CC9
MRKILKQMGKAIDWYNVLRDYNTEIVISKGKERSFILKLRKLVEVLPPALEEEFNNRLKKLEFK